MFFFLRTIQKVLPLFLVIELPGTVSSLVIFVGIATAVAGGLGTTNVKFVMVYSTILRLSWILAGGAIFLALTFLLIYRAGFYVIAAIFWGQGMREVQDSVGVGWGVTRVFLLFALLRISGLPPFLGFIAKVALLQVIIIQQELALATSLVISSGIYVFIYFRLALSRLEWEARRLNMETLSPPLGVAIRVFLLTTLPVIIFSLYAF
jgi:NADH:ubiquinone oxidoreductase subunit 2 (subunit N)